MPGMRTVSHWEDLWAVVDEEEEPEVMPFQDMFDLAVRPC
jgi:hypothetical protein